MSNKPNQDLKAGDLVRVKPEEVYGFLTGFQPKIDRGRVGVVVRNDLDWGRTLVDYPKCGRRPALRAQIHAARLERVPEDGSPNTGETA